MNISFKENKVKNKIDLIFNPIKEISKIVSGLIYGSFIGILVSLTYFLLLHYCSSFIKEGAIYFTIYRNCIIVFSTFLMLLWLIYIINFKIFVGFITSKFFTKFDTALITLFVIFKFGLIFLYLYAGIAKIDYKTNYLFKSLFIFDNSHLAIIFAFILSRIILLTIKRYFLRKKYVTLNDLQKGKIYNEKNDIIPVFDPDFSIDDAFNRKDLINSFEYLLFLEGNSSFIAAINGEWGSGKTSLFSFTLKDIFLNKKIRNNKFKIKYLNLIKYRTEEALINAFVDSIYTSIKTEILSKSVKSYLKGVLNTISGKITNDVLILIQ